MAIACHRFAVDDGSEENVARTANMAGQPLVETTRVLRVPRHINTYRAQVGTEGTFCEGPRLPDVSQRQATRLAFHVTPWRIDLILMKTHGSICEGIPRPVVRTPHE